MKTSWGALARKLLSVVKPHRCKEIAYILEVFHAGDLRVEQQCWWSRDLLKARGSWRVLSDSSKHQVVPIHAQGNYTHPILSSILTVWKVFGC